MMMPTHAATGLIGTSIVARIFGITNEWFYVCGVLFSVGPDLDFLYYLWKRKKWNITHRVDDHRKTIFHAPLFYVVTSLFFFIPAAWLKSSDLLALGTIYLGNSLGHLFLDSVFIGKGIPWFFPLNKKFYGWFLFEQKKFETDYLLEYSEKWFKWYRKRPLFILENVYFLYVLYWFVHRLSLT